MAFSTVVRELEEVSQATYQSSSGSTMPKPAAPDVNKKRAGACSRCRQRKVRCDGALPACSNCAKAGIECQVLGRPDSKTQEDYVSKLESHIRNLEDRLQRQNAAASTDESSFDAAPELSKSPTRIHSVPSQHRTPTLQDSAQSTLFANVAGSNHVSPAVSVPLSIGPAEPIAHEVGLLSLANATEPKYVGPSSGVTFARLMYAAAPQTQGLPAALYTSDIAPHQSRLVSPCQPASLPNRREMYYFIDAYFERIHPLYPFLCEVEFYRLAERCAAGDSTWPSRPMSPIAETTEPDQRLSHFNQAQLYLVLFLGATLLEFKLSQHFGADSYLFTAMDHVSRLQLHDSIVGIQTLLLLTLSSFYSPHGLNAWYLKSTIIASCIDLGLQRKRARNRAASSELGDLSVNNAEQTKHDIQSGIFWSAYSIDRTLSVVLGRPLTLRDEALDIEFPGAYASTEVDRNPTALYEIHSQQTDGPMEPPAKRTRQSPSVSPAIYSFRFDRITAEIKLMLFRVAQSPERFPWPSDHDLWQRRTNEALAALLAEMNDDLSRSKRPQLGRGHDVMSMLIELKYHHCMMLLYRPSPAIPKPSALALKFGFESAMETIRIHSELLRFGDFDNSWLNAHTTFIAGITVLYCLWVSPQIRAVTPLRLFSYYSDLCLKILETLGKTWSVAENASQKFKAMAEITKSTWHQNEAGFNMPGQQNLEMPNQSYSNIGGNNHSEVPVLDIPEDPNINWSNFDLDYGSTNQLLDELGEMSDWFFLDWLGGENDIAGAA